MNTTVPDPEIDDILSADMPDEAPEGEPDADGLEMSETAEEDDESDDDEDESDEDEDDEDEDDEDETDDEEAA